MNVTSAPEPATQLGSSTDDVLRVEELKAGYAGRAVVHGVSFAVRRGSVTAIFGHNGAGKSTTMKAVAGLLPCFGGRVELFGQDVTKQPVSHRVNRGLVALPQEKSVFSTVPVWQNLELGAALVNDRAEIEARRERVVELFPRLGERKDQIAGSMSGGEQRMLSMGIALMAGAKVLLLDEPSLGLAPKVNQNLLDATQKLVQDHGLSVVLVEQAIGTALEYADHVYVMRSGEIVSEHTGDEARARDDWWEVF
jgi:branched-chain amino acid transport system ATP-binding protein